MKKWPFLAIILSWMVSYGSETSFLHILSARDDLVKVSWKSDARKCQNKLPLLTLTSWVKGTSSFMGAFEWKKTYRSKARCHPKASLHTLRYCLIFLRCVFARSEPNLTTHNFYAIQRVGIWEGAKYFFLDAKGIVSSTVCCRMQKKTCGKEDAKLCWRFDAGILPLTLHRSGFTLQNNAVHQNAWVGIIILKLQQFFGQNERCHWKGGPLKGGWQVGRPEMPMTLFPSVGLSHPSRSFLHA